MRFGLLTSLLMLCLLGSACVRPQPQPDGAVPQRPAADWMELQHPGPYVSVTPPGGSSERCQSCHQFETLSTISSFLPADLQAEQPREFTEPADPLNVGGTHPGGWLSWHDPEVVGCVACHGGEPLGLSYKEAGHARMLDNNAELDKAPVQVLREASCGRCHSGELVPAAPLLSEGRALMRELNCSACHELPGWLSGGYAGPDLGRIGGKYSAGLLALMPMHVQRFKPGSRMPEFELPELEAAHIASFLAGDALPPADSDNQPVAVDNPEALALLDRSRCVNCHSLPELPESVELATLPEDLRLLWELPQGSLGPGLQYSGRRLSAAWITDFLLNTHSRNPGSRMPQLELDAAQAGLLAGWLVSASSAAGPDLPELPELSAAYPVEGNSLFISRGCAGCHALDGETLKGSPVGPSLLGVGERTMEQWQFRARMSTRSMSTSMATCANRPRLATASCRASS
ncbi:MAG: c-type cytochrome [bacterium]